MADVEWRPRRVLDQIVRRGHADQHERDPFQLGVEGAVLIQETDGGKEIVGEIEPQRGVDLVDEQHQPFRALDERDLAQVTDQPVREGVLLVRVPPGRRALAQIELLLHAQEEALVPLVGRRLGAELREVDDDRERHRCCASRSAARYIRLDLPICRDVRM